MGKLEKVMYILGFIAVLLILSFITFIVIMAWKLDRYDKCYDNNFELSYCEKYKDF